MIKITADSTCDLSPEIIKSMEISLVPIYVVIDDQEYRDGVDINSLDLFRYVEEERKSCKTAAVNLYEYESFFKDLSSKHDAVIHVSLGSGFSSCYQNAVLAAEKFDNVYIIDSCNLSTGSGHVVYDAAQMAQNGLSAKEICKALNEDIVPNLDSSFIIDKLDYLRKGGRCSGMEALGAKILKIKPCIEVVDGKMKVGKKYRGNLEYCIENYIKDNLSNKEDIDYRRLFITHSIDSPEIIERVKEIINTHSQFDEVIETIAGCTISCHCGPNTLGILFKRKKQ